MTSSYTHQTALKIYVAIAASGDNGIDIAQLHQATGLAKNTLISYGRAMADEGAILIQSIHSDAVNRPLKNLYLSVREPRPRLTEAERLKLIVEKLEPFEPRHHPETEKWDAVQYAVRDALLIARAFFW